MQRIHNLPVFRERRLELRKKQTFVEEKLWLNIKNKKLGVKFRRQHSIGGYIVDFYYRDKKLIIELDGSVHDSEESREYDAKRDDFFTQLDYKILRFTNNEIENNIESVLIKIKSFL